MFHARAILLTTMALMPLATQGASTNSGAALTERQERLVCLVAQSPSWADEFAREKALAVRTRAQSRPLVGLVFASGGPKQNAQLTGLPRHQNGGEVVARCDLDLGWVYLGRENESDLLHELGHWYFGTSERTADEFMNFCRHRKDRLAVAAGMRPSFVRAL